MNDYSPIYGVEPPKALPKYTPETVLLHAERFNRAAAAQSQWSEPAKLAVEYFENFQWREEDLRKLHEEGRPSLTINKIKPLVMLVMGYHINNGTDIGYLPGHDGSGTAEIAKALSHISKQINQLSRLPFVDTAVFLDGLLCGRGFYDGRLNFEHNDFGDFKWRSQDPFSTYPDPDGMDYDLNQSNFITTSRYVSIDEIEFVYGRLAAEMVRPLVGQWGYSGFPSHLWDGFDEMTPWRRFGGEREERDGAYAWFGDMLFDFVDRQRKSVRLIDTQHYVPVRRPFFVDLETGDRKPVPEHWPREKVMKVMAWAEERGDPLRIQVRQTRRVRWTHMIGDIIVMDQWSPYNTFTTVPFFPYFRRGKTKGMVEDLMDSQDEINRRRSARLNIIGRASNGGWIIEKSTMDAQARAHHDANSSAPGYNLYWDSKGGKRPAPSPIQPGQSPLAMSQLEMESDNDIKEIAGVNPDALGLVDKVKSGRAIEANQRQTIVGIEPYLQNWKQTRTIQGEKQLDVIQNHYTEERVIRTIGEGNSTVQVIINQQTAAGVINNVTLGKYSVSIDDSPLSASFLEGQFEEIMRLKELGMPIPDDFIIDASSLGRKEELKMAIRAQREALLRGTALGSGTVPGGGPVGADGGNLPAAQEPGVPAIAAE